MNTSVVSPSSATEGMGEFLCTCFPNYSVEMYNGNIPAGDGHEMVNGGFSARWETKHGGGETYKGRVITAQYSINHKVTVYITGNSLGGI